MPPAWIPVIHGANPEPEGAAVQLQIGLTSGHLQRYVFRCPQQRYRKMKGCAAGTPSAFDLQPATEGRQGIRAPVQSDPGIRAAGFGRKATIEHSVAISRHDTGSLIRKAERKALARTTHPASSADPQTAVLRTRLAYRFGRVDDQVLNHLLQRDSRQQQRKDFGLDLHRGDYRHASPPLTGSDLHFQCQDVTVFTEWRRCYLSTATALKLSPAGVGVSPSGARRPDSPPTGHSSQ